MKKIVAVLIVLGLCANMGFAESYIYFGIYGDSNIPGYPQDVTGSCKYRTGIHLEKTALNDEDFKIVPFLENEVLMDTVSGYNFSPASENYILGVNFVMNPFVFMIKHECRHAFGERSKVVEQYNLVELKYNFSIE